MMIYRMSELGGCMKAMVAKGLGYEPKETSTVKTKAGKEMREYYDEGTRLEDVVIDRLRRDGWAVHNQQLEVNIQILTNSILQGHIDGMGENEDLSIKRKVLEVKSMTPDQFKMFKSLGWEMPGLVQKYKWQLSGYMIGTGLEGMLVVVNSDPELDDEDRPLLFMHVEMPFYSKAEIVNRILTVESWVKSGDLPKLCDNRIFPCPFPHLHEDDTEYVDDPELDGLAAEFKAAQRDEKAAKDRKAAAEKKLLALIGTRTRVDTGQFHVVRWQQANNPSFDKEAAKEAGVDIEKFMSQSKGWRMRVEEQK